MCPTPYGDIADCLLSDAPAEVLSRYHLVLVSGIEHDVPGVRERLDAFCGSGGVAMATGDDAARLWPEYCLARVSPVAAGEEVCWNTHYQLDREACDFDLHEAKLPATANVLATCRGRPAVVSIPHGGGTLLLALAATGMNRTRLACQPSRNPYSGHGENTGLERPFHLLTHVSRAYDCRTPVAATVHLWQPSDGDHLPSRRTAHSLSESPIPAFAASRLSWCRTSAPSQRSTKSISVRRSTTSPATGRANTDRSIRKPRRNAKFSASLPEKFLLPMRSTSVAATFVSSRSL